jgi:antitoxin (DNA-binding transcriptional repressor) of toxin-antitoxin stability system
MVTVNLYQAKAQFSRLVSAVEKQGERIILCRNGIPVADLVPHASIPSKKLDPDPLFAGARFVGDPTAPLEAGDWPENLR